MLRAVPAMIRMADSTLLQLRSGNFVVAISWSWALEMEPTFPLEIGVHPFQCRQLC
jgi:hypothetical protein